MVHVKTACALGVTETTKQKVVCGHLLSVYLISCLAGVKTSTVDVVTSGNIKRVLLDPLIFDIIYRHHTKRKEDVMFKYLAIAFLVMFTATANAQQRELPLEQPLQAFVFGCDNLEDAQRVMEAAQESLARSTEVHASMQTCGKGRATFLLHELVSEHQDADGDTWGIYRATMFGRGELYLMIPIRVCQNCIQA